MGKLTAVGIQRIKNTGKVQKLADSGGLHLFVTADGSKLWRWNYRHGGKHRTASFGAYPAVSLADARERHAAGRKLLAAGTDPMAQKKADQQAALAAAEHSFESVARTWHAQWAPAHSERHARYVVARFEADVFPAIGTLPVAAVEAPHLVGMCKAIEARGALDLAKRALQMTSQVLRYAVAHGIGGARRNPAADIKPSDVIAPRRATNYARIDARELPSLLRAIEGYRGTPTTRLAIKLMALTFVRTSELIGARWSEFDLDTARWDIPAGRMKMKTPHVVPLSRQAVEVLEVLHDISGHRELLFPGERDHAKPMSNNTILMALDRMGFGGKMTGHGFRGLASTLLHEQGFEHAHIELQLAHMERNSVSASYNHATYLPQRAAMMQQWADFLDSSLRGNVVPLRRLAA